MNVIEAPLIECLALCEILWCTVSMLYKWWERACVECYVGPHYVFIHINFELLNLIFKVYLLPNHLKEFCSLFAVNNAYLNTEGNGTITDNSQIRSRNMPIAYFHQTKFWSENALQKYHFTKDSACSCKYMDYVFISIVFDVYFQIKSLFRLLVFCITTIIY